jgi:hypothetical protein
MKHLLLVLICSGLMGNATQADDILEDIGLALKAGNAKEVANYFIGEVAFSTPSSEGSYKPAKAENKLRKFFTAHPPKEFNTLHTGVSKANSKYLIGKLKTSKGTFRTYLLLVEGGKEKQPRISELEFE